MKSGQILILVLLIVVVTLSVGLSVASRNLTNLKTSTQTEESQRAFSAAEGGVEDVLSKLDSIQTALGGGTNSSGCSISGSTATCPVSGLGDTTVSASVTVSASSTYEQTLDPGDVGQIDLSNGYSGNLTIEWAKNNTTEVGPAASLELTFICNNTGINCAGFDSNFVTAPSVYKIRKYFLYDSSGSWPGESGSRTAVLCNSTATTYKCSYNLATATTNILFLRIRPLWKPTTLRITGGVNFPTQSYNVDSSANTTQGISRRVTVTKTALPTLPAAFDFALYSEGEIVK